MLDLVKNISEYGNELCTQSYNTKFTTKLNSIEGKLSDISKKILNPFSFQEDSCRELINLKTSCNNLKRYSERYFNDLNGATLATALSALGGLLGTYLIIYDPVNIKIGLCTLTSTCIVSVCQINAYSDFKKKIDKLNDEIDKLDVNVTKFLNTH